MTEHDIKHARLLILLRQAGLDGVLLATPPNFAWATCGGTNRIDITREPGAGALLVARDGRRAVLANTIEMPRLLADVFAGQVVEPIEWPWAAERANPTWVLEAARAFTGGSIGADWPIGDAVRVDAALAAARAPLTTEEIARYRALGADAGRAVAELCRGLTPGLTEREVADRAVAAMAGIGARAVVALAAGDDRIARFRHPVPSDAPWQHRALLGVCAERHGLTVALSRMVTVGAPPDDLRARVRQTARVFGALLTHAIAGVTGAALFARAVEAYAAAGAPGEELRHHQGGAIGYRARDWVAHPASTDRVTPPQAFAWNPTVPGAKTEDTALVTEGGVEIITASPGWPTIEIEARGRRIGIADILEI